MKKLLRCMTSRRCLQCKKARKKKEIARLDEVLYRLFSDLSATHQLLSMVRFHWPHPHKAKFTYFKKTATGNMGFLTQKVVETVYTGPPYRGIKLVDRIENGESHQERSRARAHLGHIWGAFSATRQPVGQRNIQARLDAEDAQRQALSKFWKGMIERHQNTLCRLDIDETDIDSDLKILSVDSEPAFLEAVEPERNEILAAIAAKELAKVAKSKKQNGILGDLVQTQWGSEDQAKGNVAGPGHKIKTRGESTHVNDEVPAPSNEGETKPEKQLIRVTVNKRNHTLFKGMFPGHDIEARSQSTHWNTFVNAMGAPGVEFVARRRAGGSEFSFEPSSESKWAGMHPIVFHRPHLESGIDPITLASWGKRMTKHFGWNKDTFVLK